MNYPIVKTGKGYYLDAKKYSVDEIEFILKAVNDAKECENIDKTELCKKLQNTLNQIYRG